MFAGLFKRFFGTKGFTKIVTNQAVTVTLPNRPRPFTMASDHRLFPALVEALNARNEEAVLGIVAVVEQVTQYGEGNVEVKNGQVYYKGEVVHNVVAERILQFIAEGVPCNYLFKFLERVLQNPLESARKELFLFLENGQLPIMTDGRFQAYKWVDNDLKDCHTHSFNNAPGQIVKMDREKCDTNRNRDCSSGLHVCTQNYMKFGQRLVLVAVDPADVMSVPYDYNNAKMRVCQYEVLEEIKGDDYGHRKHKGIVQYKPALTEAERRKQVDEQQAAAQAPAADDFDSEEEDVCTHCKAPLDIIEPVEDSMGNEFCGEGCMETYNQDDEEIEHFDEGPYLPTGNYQVRFTDPDVPVIPAIKALRTAYSMGLQEAKDLVTGAKTFIRGISEDAAQKIKTEMAKEHIAVRVEEMGARKKKPTKKVEKAKKPAKSKASKQKEKAMDDATWTKFKQAVKNKKSIKGFGLSDEDAKTYREKARKELNNVKV